MMIVVVTRVVAMVQFHKYALTELNTHLKLYGFHMGTWFGINKTSEHRNHVILFGCWDCCVWI